MSARGKGHMQCIGMFWPRTSGSVYHCLPPHFPFPHLIAQPGSLCPSSQPLFSNLPDLPLPTPPLTRSPLLRHCPPQIQVMHIHFVEDRDAPGAVLNASQIRMSHFHSAQAAGHQCSSEEKEGLVYDDHVVRVAELVWQCKDGRGGPKVSVAMVAASWERGLFKIVRQPDRSARMHVIIMFFLFCLFVCFYFLFLWSVLQASMHGLLSLGMCAVRS